MWDMLLCIFGSNQLPYAYTSASFLVMQGGETLSLVCRLQGNRLATGGMMCWGRSGTMGPVESKAARGVPMARLLHVWAERSNKARIKAGVTGIQQSKGDPRERNRTRPIRPWNETLQGKRPGRPHTDNEARETQGTRLELPSAVWGALP